MLLFYNDLSPVNTITIPGGGLSRVSLWTNARYQTHEVLITAGILKK